MTFKALLKSSTLAVVAFLTPIQGVLLATLVLTVLDLVTGILASMRQKTPITSYGLKRSVVKLCLYQISLIVAYLSDLYLTSGVNVVSLAGTLIGLTELKSILENLDTISGTKLLSGIVDVIQRESSAGAPGPTVPPVQENLPPNPPG